MPEVIAVLNAGGAQARAIARQLGAAGYTLRRLSRSAGPDLTRVDPESLDSLTAGLAGADGVVFTLPQDYRPGVRDAYAERVARAAEAAGVRRIVLNTAGPVYEDSDEPVAVDLRRLRGVVQGGAVPVVTLQPTSFLDNLVEPWAAAPIVNDGVLAYPTPAGAAVSWISHDDLGRFVAAAFRTDVTGRVFDIGGPEPIDPQRLTSAIGAALGRTVRYQEVPLESFAAGLNAAFGPPAGDHIAGLYRAMQTRPDAMARDPDGWAELGVQPESVEAWAARQPWRA